MCPSCPEPLPHHVPCPSFLDPTCTRVRTNPHRISSHLSFWAWVTSTSILFVCLFLPFICKFHLSLQAKSVHIYISVIHKLVDSCFVCLCIWTTAVSLICRHLWSETVLWVHTHCSWVLRYRYFLLFEKLLDWFPKWQQQFTLSATVYIHTIFSTSIPARVVTCILDDSHHTWDTLVFLYDTKEYLKEAGKIFLPFPTTCSTQDQIS